jgi:hypothetical protein
MGSGLIISTSTPDTTNRYTWLKPISTGFEVYELLNGAGWTKTGTVTPTQLGSIEFKSDIVVDGDKGVTNFYDCKLHNIKTLKCKNGVITELELEKL